MQKYGRRVFYSVTNVSKAVNSVAVIDFLVIYCGIKCLFSEEIVLVGINVVILRSFLIQV